MDITSLPSLVVAGITNELSPEDLVSLLQASTQVKEWITSQANEFVWKRVILQSWPEDDEIGECESYYKLHQKKRQNERIKLSFPPGRFLISVLECCTLYDSYENHPSKFMQKSTKWWWVYRIRENLQLRDSEARENGEKIENYGRKLCEDSEVPEITDANFCQKYEFKDVGWLRFLSISDALRKFPNSKLLRTPPECPYLDKTIGYINCDFYGDILTLQNLRIDIHKIVYEACGFIGRVDKDYARHLDEKLVDGMDMFSKFGLYDGDRFVTTHPESKFIKGIMRSAQLAIDEAFGTNYAMVYYMQTSHNPVRCTPYNSQIENLEFTVWLADWPLLDCEVDKNMWGP
jgi:hypothetical protein